MSLSMALPDWQGPVAFEMRLKSDHDRTVRYDCPLDRGKFSLYVPKLLLQSAVGDEASEYLHVTVEKSSQPAREMGFTGRPMALQTGPDFWEYRYSQEKANSIRYITRVEGKPYSVYLPMEVLAGRGYPQRIVVRVNPWESE